MFHGIRHNFWIKTKLQGETLSKLCVSFRMKRIGKFTSRFETIMLRLTLYEMLILNSTRTVIFINGEHFTQELYILDFMKKLSLLSELLTSKNTCITITCYLKCGIT